MMSPKGLGRPELALPITRMSLTGARAPTGLGTSGYTSPRYPSSQCPPTDKARSVSEKVALWPSMARLLLSPREHLRKGAMGARGGEGLSVARARA